MCLNKNIINDKTKICMEVWHIRIHLRMHFFALRECASFYDPEGAFNFLKITFSDTCELSKENKEWLRKLPKNVMLRFSEKKKKKTGHIICYVSISLVVLKCYIF